MSTTLTPPPGYTSNEMVFNDSFQGSSLDSSYWNTYMTSAASGGYPWFSNGSGGSAIGPAGSLDAEYDQASHVSVNNGLTLLATHQSTESGYAYTSGTVSSYDKVEFDGGYLQVSMKEPAGDGSWPAIWLLPGAASGQKTDNAEIDVQEGGFTGSGNVNDTVANHLHEGGSQWGKDTNVGTDLTAGYNTYAIDWVPGKSITWYLNGKETEQITSAQANIPNEPMELIFSEAVAGPSASGWRTVTDQNTPANMAMMVNDVQLYQTAGDTLYLNGKLASPSGVPAPTTPSAGGTTAPTIPYGVVNSNDSVTLTGNATAGSTVTVWDGGANPLGTTTANSAYVWSFTTGALSGGAYAFTATDTTSAGTSAKSSALNVTVPTAAASKTSPAAGSATSLPAAPTIPYGVVNSNDSVTLTGNATAGSKVTVWDGGANPLGTTTANSAFVWSFTTADLAAGPYAFTATDTTSAGTSAYSNPLNLTVHSATSTG
jgi:beta-glucanase (GH16 family)